MAPRCLGAMTPRCLGSLVPWRHGALVPWCHGATEPWCLGAMAPRCQDSLVPRCTDIKLDKDTTMAGHYTSIGVRHWRRLQHCTRRCDAVVFRERPLDIVCLTIWNGTHATLGLLGRIPLVRTSSELAVRRAGKAPEGTVPSPSPGRHAATRSRRGSSSSSPPTADGFGTGTPVPSPQSQSFSLTYGSILPISHSYIVLSTRGFSPWRPYAVMSMIGCGRHSVLRIFKGRRERTGHLATCGALPAAGPYVWLSRFQGRQAVK
ncbi:hypothetical protein CQW23_34778 [Capsicum baccatum]|uniref:Uncharacterized protein n=1 Tax=Capsicum baccatum TaxID=33114 RepID=A0A2G2UY43_CAPBA|nr:hypothetical protein CQW23_34778 [Capsicum baccatum]